MSGPRNFVIRCVECHAVMNPHYKRHWQSVDLYCPDCYEGTIEPPTRPLAMEFKDELAKTLELEKHVRTKELSRVLALLQTSATVNDAIDAVRRRIRHIALSLVK